MQIISRFLLLLVFGLSVTNVFACPHHGDSQAAQDKIGYHAQIDLEELEEFAPEEDEEAEEDFP
ncbi:hypothetical protein [Cysteiniphilum sp. 6C5]|uniref:hypothetical protein n=1 Tax=unclassified Cysteiniphilum TaxID=2610889 RepID=UPI003F852363